MSHYLPVALRETMRVHRGVLPLLPRHLARLEAGGCPSVVAEAAGAAAMDAAAAWKPAYGRMTLSVHEDGLFDIEVSDRPSTIDVEGGPLIALVEADAPLLPPGAAKPLDRGPWDEALHVAQRQGAHVAVLVSRDGRLIDTSQATLWLVLGGRLLTPPSPPALAGVSRGVVFDDAPALGIEVCEQPVTSADLQAAEEVFLTTAVAGVRAVRGRGGPVSEAIRAAFEALFECGGAAATPEG